ncbi:NUDIX domain-containing protein [Gordonia rubripertincta]|uniref:NUDIX domain-containing protein n=2 Tax=Gordonia rubripertincta TaxID=36822 RepID=A0AAW4G5S5_GORRU|nr:NUDIX domain-containing protein [Gordonia rubripertincta]MBM7278431.1 NUDIX domain-containing protein [Gordonia rubripertincta]MDG6779410.1 NUDIX domain-containing protein [Gordonia rubripertincta]NKY62719.1 NUDIX domain-containing protein [Gordonia rubripertincta]QMU18901.1 NUDIX domain-containing protein [Gordonia rubripertincta]TSD98349.1 NUDIX hydrolase [Gordonia rubripertincta]
MTSTDQGPEVVSAPIRDAATVVLVRDSADGIEVFLQRRVKQMAFAGGMTVFPGGGVDKRDAGAHVAWTGPDPAWWAEQFNTDEELAQALVCAAVRETFEECGVLLATTDDGAFADPGALADDRQRLVEKSLSFAEFLTARGLTLRADLLSPLAHWITPVNEKRRYDTRFFLAAMPEGQKADAETTEAEVARWVNARLAIDTWAGGKHFLMPPTWAQLHYVSGFPSVEELLAAERSIECILPNTTPGAGLAGLGFPGSDEYFRTLGDQTPPEITL